MRIEINANVVKACEARSIDILHAVIGDQKTLFPSHKHGPRVTIHGQVGSLELVLNVAKCRETCPMHHVALLIGTPPPGQEAMTTANDFCIKVGRELRPVIC